ncbi:extracellular solute-binding protein [Streptosporangium sp. NPDC050855]|uniref:extracellular solute-binding protein n=1 Tax=Streptosporangium sp. NPDC050855 TaxID=3366194 RepID=UPI00379D95E9
MTGTLSRRSALGLCGAAGLAAALPSCGRDAGTGFAPASPALPAGEYSGPRVTLDCWNGFTGGDGPYLRAMLEAFNRRFSGRIAVRNVTRRWEDLYPAIPMAIAAGRGPDVAIVHNDWIATLAARRTLVPLDDLAGALGLTGSDFVPAVWNAGIYRGRRYSVPFDVHCLGGYWNRAHLERIGLTGAPADGVSYEEALGRLRQAGIAAPFWVPNRWPGHLMFMSLLWQFGGELYSEDGSKALWGSDAGAKALGWMVEQIDKGLSPAKVAQDGQYAAFKNGASSFTWDGIWQINDLTSNTGSLRWGLSPLPVVGGTAAVWSSSHNFVMTSRAGGDPDKVRAAGLLIDHMSRLSARWAGAGMIPARTSVRLDPSLAGLPQIRLAADPGVLRFLPSLPGVGDVQTKALEPAVARAVLKEASPAEALKAGVALADRLLAENTRKYGR